MKSASNPWTQTALTTPDGLRLFLQHTAPKQAREVIGSVLLVHGWGEHSGRFAHVIEAFNAAGLEVYTFDLRGHGRSEGRRGDVKDYAHLLGDLAAAWECLPASALPRFIYGHSFGGQLVLNFYLEKRPDLSGLILSSPWLDLSFQPPRYKLVLANCLRRIWPSLIQSTGIRANHLSADVDFVRSLDPEHLVHRKLSIRAFFSLLEGAERARAGAASITCPVLLFHGTDDRVTCPLASERFFSRLGSEDKTLHLWPEMPHETHNTPEREKVIRQVVQWTVERAGARP